MLKITKRTELMFAQAVALAQSGRMKSHIHASGRVLYVANMDNTILLRFTPDMDFPQPISFFANDYESPHIELSPEGMTFITTKNGYTQRKTVGVPKTSFQDVEAIWNKHTPVNTHAMMIRKEISQLLDSDLSHVEFHKDKNTLVLVQKNIYTGARVEVRDTQAANGLISVHSFPQDFKPVGIRTHDLLALFTFVDTLTFHPQEGKDWMFLRDNTGLVSGILSTCLYDELGYFAESSNGEEA